MKNFWGKFINNLEKNNYIIFIKCAEPLAIFTLSNFFMIYKLIQFYSVSNEIGVDMIILCFGQIMFIFFLLMLALLLTKTEKCIQAWKERDYKTIWKISTMLVFSLKMFIIAYCGSSLTESSLSLTSKCVVVFIMYLTTLVVLYNTFIAEFDDE